MPQHFGVVTLEETTRSDVIIEKWNDLGVRIINQGLDVRRKIGFPSSDLFASVLSQQRVIGGVAGAVLGFFVSAKKSFNEGDIQKLSNLNSAAIDWIGKSQAFVNNQGKNAFTPRLLTNWGNNLDDVVTLRKFTVPAARFTREDPDLALQAFIGDIEKSAGDIFDKLPDPGDLSTLVIVAIVATLVGVFISLVVAISS